MSTPLKPSRPNARPPQIRSSRGQSKQSPAKQKRQTTLPRKKTVDQQLPSKNSSPEHLVLEAQNSVALIESTPIVQQQPHSFCDCECFLKFKELQEALMILENRIRQLEERGSVTPTLPGTSQPESHTPEHFDAKELIFFHPTVHSSFIKLVGDQLQKHIDARRKRGTSIYVVFSTGVRFLHDLTEYHQLKEDGKDIWLVDLYTGANQKSSIVWPADIGKTASLYLDTDMGIDGFVDPTTVGFENEILRLQENVQTLDLIFGVKLNQ